MYACMYILLEVCLFKREKKPTPNNQVFIHFNELIVRHGDSSENSKNGVWGEVGKKLLYSAEETWWCRGICVWGIASLEKNINAVSAK